MAVKLGTKPASVVKFVNDQYRRANARLEQAKINLQKAHQSGNQKDIEAAREEYRKAQEEVKRTSSDYRTVNDYSNTQNNISLFL